MDCAKARSLAWKISNHEKYINQNLDWKFKNPEKVRKSKLAWREVNRERERQVNTAWSKANRGVRNALWMKREAKKLRATPAWLVAADYDRIAALYTEAARLTRETGVVHHVDHIIPLQGKTVSGLHVPENLQILTAEKNYSKHNKLLELH